MPSKSWESICWTVEIFKSDYKDHVTTTKVHLFWSCRPSLQLPQKIPTDVDINAFETSMSSQLYHPYHLLCFYFRITLTFIWC